MSTALESQLQKATKEYQRLETDLSNAIEARQRLDVQLTENEQVQKEFLSLTSDNEVFKLIGPVLVKQDQGEAKSNVEKRLEYIRNEISRLEVQLKDLNSKQERKRLELVNLQGQIESNQHSTSGAIPAQ
ncbi:Prefoldin beta-like protein [Dacryopinax primogenitus]|uniref:Prefoldin beta-like protein n=1 Tax=Dacryopinax primogenitus (strain DJM 731) TaxID=1858805 RepID=M5FX23_DACPD|nr:Prefoldin beta-like protein [Dacryopinax primogenitus]EJU02541.1 Prefoldin beta-like protein [Dacryopinax primogenitus]